MAYKSVFLNVFGCLIRTRAKSCTASGDDSQFAKGNESLTFEATGHKVHSVLSSFDQTGKSPPNRFLDYITSFNSVRSKLLLCTLYCTLLSSSVYRLMRDWFGNGTPFTLGNASIPSIPSSSPMWKELERKLQETS